MSPIAHLRLQLLTLTEELGTASAHLRVAERSEAAHPTQADAALQSASDSIAELSSDLAILDAALQRHRNPEN